MSEYGIVLGDRDAILAAMYHDIQAEGLRMSVQRRLDEIDEAVKDLPYLNRRYILERLSDVLALIDVGEQVVKDNNIPGKWVSVGERLPAETHSIFFKWYGRKEWTNAMWREQSDKVLVTVTFEDGTRMVTTGETHDGQWHTSISRTLNPVVTHWMPMPKAPEDGNVG